MDQLGGYLNQVSLWLILLGLVLSELGLPLPETVFVVAAGVVSQKGGAGIAMPIISSSLAVFFGDALLFQLARRYGEPAFQRWPLCLLLPARVYPRIDALLRRHGPMAIFVARFLAGVRGAMFVLAGMRKMPFSRFLLWDGLAILLTVPVFAAIGYMFSSSVVSARAQVERANAYLLGLLAVVVTGYSIFIGARWFRGRRSVSSTAPRSDG